MSHAADTTRGRGRETRISEVMFYYPFMGAEREREAVAVLVTRGRRTHTLFARVVSWNGIAHEHRAQELLKEGFAKVRQL